MPNIKARSAGAISEALRYAVSAEVDNGLPAELHDRLVSNLAQYNDCFRLQFGADPPVSVEPLQIQLKKARDQ